MICLGIESTAHTLGIGIVDDTGNILANEKSAFATDLGGIHPSKAAQHHILFYELVLKKALDKSKLTIKDMDIIAFSQGPGLGSCLRVGAVVARSLAKIYKKPLVGVNHCIAHVESGKLTSGFKDPITLYVSGANTQILAFASGRYRVFGETLDIGIGNFLDAFGRTIDLGFPAGPTIDKLAAQGKNYIDLPYVVKGMDFSFSGLQTKLSQLKLTKQYSKEDLCYSATETSFAMLVEATERAIAHIGKNEVVLTGGVAASKRLQEMCRTMCEARGVKFDVVPADLARDNGAMIAIAGLLEHKSGIKTKLSAKPIQGWRTDDVNAIWVT